VLFTADWEPQFPDSASKRYSHQLKASILQPVEFFLIFLASAIRDNEDAKVITTEFDPEKVERAKKNIAAAGLEEWVEFRLGNALETLKSDLPHEIDLILLDGAKGLYLDVLKLLQPHLRRGGTVACENADNEGLDAFLEYLRDPGNGYTSSALRPARR
jgi:tRNA A58 N-methylase Trm61